MGFPKRPVGMASPPVLWPPGSGRSRLREFLFPIQHEKICVRPGSVAATAVLRPAWPGVEDDFIFSVYGGAELPHWLSRKASRDFFLCVLNRWSP